MRTSSHKEVIEINSCYCNITVTNRSPQKSVSPKSWWFFNYRYGRFLMSVWCVKISHFIKTWIKPRTLLQNRWWGSGLLALKQLQCEGMWVCWPSMHAHNLLWESLLWEMGWVVFSWLSNEVFPMPVLCSSSAMENVMIRSRIKKKIKKNPTLLLLFFQCKIKLPVIIYSNPDNWRLRLALRMKTRIFNSFQALFPWPHLNDLFNQKPL